jgi:lactoylglutathione lyase
MTIATSGIHHLGLTVTDLERSRRFYQELFGWQEVGADTTRGYAFLTDGKNMITLWQQSGTAYDKTRAGLHHFALSIDSVEAMDRAERLLREKGVRIHYDRVVPLAEGASESEIYFYDPDGIRVELFCAAGGAGLTAPVAGAPSCVLAD